MDLDLSQLRADTPGVEHVVHLNNAGSALPPTVVTDTVVEHLRLEAAIGGYEAARDAADRIDAVYGSLADLVAAEADEIAVVENATRAWDMAVYGFPFEPGDRVLTGRSEYASNVIALLQIQRHVGIEIVLIDDDEFGQISLDQLDAELDHGAAMVALTHVPTNGGLVNPAAEVGDRCRDAGVCFVLDACQSIGQLPIDVDEIGCDVLSATGRKYLRGPRGTGFLYVRRKWIERLEPPLLDLHSATWTDQFEYDIRSDARRFETWETSYATKLGLGAAADYARTVGIDASWPRIQLLADQLRAGLAELDGVGVHDKGAVRGGIVTFSVRGREASEVQDELTAQSINTSVSPQNYAHFDLPHRGLPALVRASVHYYNTTEEIERVLDAVAGMVARS